MRTSLLLVLSSSLLAPACSSSAPAGAPVEPAPAPAPAKEARSAPAASPTPAADPCAAGSESALYLAVASPKRPEDDRVLDARRHPCQVLSFLGIEPGMKVADMMAGRGYYTEILARAVGAEGQVFAQNTAYVVENFADEALDERLSRPGLEHVTRLDRELEDPGLPEGELDAAMMMLFYHDTYWMKIDRAKMNAAIFAALRPGGVYGVADHHAEAGSGARDAKDLHRVDAELVKEEILAAGFVLEGESELLRHPGDDRKTNVFDDSIRFETDRFLYRFRKPD